MSLFRIAKVEQDKHVERAVSDVKKASDETRTAVAKLLAVLDNVPLEEVLASMGDDLNGRDRKAGD